MTLSLATSLTELPEYRRVLGNLIARDLKVKYQTKALGFLWSLIYPAMMIAIWYVVFRRVIKIGMPHYWAFLLVGVLPFQFIQSAIMEGAMSVRRNSGLIRKVYMPLEVLVIAGVTVKLVEFILQFTIAIVFLLIAHPDISIWKTIVIVPPVILMMYLFALGVAMPLAAWSVIYRDLEHFVSIAMTALMYLTPVFWSITFIEESSWKWLLAFNPVMNFIELLRGPLYAGTWPTNGAIGGGMLAAWTLGLIFTIGSFVIGYTLFDRTKHVLAEVV